MPTSFRDGRKYTDGVEVLALHVETFASRSNPSASYSTTLWRDGDLSCNCRGWATHKHCLHCDEVNGRALNGLLRTTPVTNEEARLARQNWLVRQRWREHAHFDRIFAPEVPPLVPRRRRITPAPDRPQRRQQQPTSPPRRNDPPPPTGRKIAL